jgi:hypothetical protein
VKNGAGGSRAGGLWTAGSSFCMRYASVVIVTMSVPIVSVLVVTCL